MKHKPRIFRKGSGHFKGYECEVRDKRGYLDSWGFGTTIFEAYDWCGVRM